MTCAYCRTRRGTHRDHVLPKSLYRRLAGRELPDWIRDTVPACFTCNLRKGTRLLVPADWADRLNELNALGIGAFRVWYGDVEALREVVK